MNYSLVAVIVLIVLLVAYFTQSAEEMRIEPKACKNGICITKPKKLKQD